MQHSSNQSAQFHTPRPDGRAIVREASTHMSDVEAQQFCEFFAEGLDSGLGYARIINFLERKGISANVIRSLRHTLLEQGAQLSEAFARYGLLDASARKLILVAETQGTLPELFKLQAKIYYDRYEQKKEVAFGLVEPVLLLLLSNCWLIPVLDNIFTLYQSNDSLMIAVPKLLLGPTIVGLFAFMGYGLLAYGWLSLPVDMPSRELFSKVLMRIPFISLPSRYFSMAVFCQYFYTSTRSGLNIYDGLYLSAEASNNPMVFGSIHNALEKIEHGVSLEQSLASVSAIPRDVVDYVGMGEETGRLEEMLLKCSEIYKERARQAAQRALKSFIYLSRLIMVVIVLIFAFMNIVGKTSALNDAF